jgi:hypothetical protein
VSDPAFYGSATLSMEAQVEFADGVDDRVGLVMNLGADDLVIGVVGINVIK